MPSERYFYPGELCEGDDVSLEKKEALHFSRVMRGEVGDHVELVNGKGALAVAVVVKILKRAVQLRVEEVTKETAPSFALILVQAIPRLNRLEMIVEKATELGITELWLFPGERSEKKKLTDHQQNRLQMIAIAALKQCGRLFLPKIVMKSPVGEWNSLSYPAFFGDLREGTLLFAEEWQREPPDKGCLFFVGPESGFDEGECQKLDALGARGVKLHDHVLRTDTAPLVALSLIGHWRIQSGKR